MATQNPNSTELAPELAPDTTQTQQAQTDVKTEPKKAQSQPKAKAKTAPKKPAAQKTEANKTDAAKTDAAKAEETTAEISSLVPAGTTVSLTYQGKKVRATVGKGQIVLTHKSSKGKKTSIVTGKRIYSLKKDEKGKKTGYVIQ